MSTVLSLEEMKNMSIDDIVNLYRDGYMIEENVSNLGPEIVSAQGITVSTGSLLLVGLGVLAYMFIRKSSPI